MRLKITLDAAALLERYALDNETASQTIVRLVSEAQRAAELERRLAKNAKALHRRTTEKARLRDQLAKNSEELLRYVGGGHEAMDIARQAYCARTGRLPEET